MSPSPEGFDHVVRGDEVRISHHDRHATTLRERTAKQHPRNQRS